MTKHPRRHRAAALALTLLTGTAANAAPEADMPATRAIEPDPRVGAYALFVVGTSTMTSPVDIFECYNCNSDHSTGAKLALGWRYGVSALEVAVLDFGAAHFPPNAVYGISTNEHVRALSLGGAWTARFGNRLEATWRASAALVDVTSSGGQGPRASGRRRQWQPMWGASVGWRFDAGPSLELSVDHLLQANDVNDAHMSAMLAPSLGLRWRF